MLIMHHGHSEFLMESADGYRILTDPFDDHVGYPMHTVDCDAVTVTHGHGDHSYVQKAQGAQVIVDHAGTVHLTPEITVTGIPCWHDDQQGKLRGQNLIFIYEIDGLRVAHFGDLGAWDEELAARLEDIDILMIPVGGFFTINAASAARLIERIKPRMVLPMHYKTDANTAAYSDTPDSWAYCWSISTVLSPIALFGTLMIRSSDTSSAGFSSKRR